MEKFANVKVIAFDADDTLWDCESYCDEVEREYCRLLAPFAPADEVSASLFRTEEANMALLGYGCKAFVLSLIEKVEQSVDLEKQKEMEKRLRNAEFTYDDFLEQMRQMEKMGGLSTLLSMMPGMGNINMDGFDDSRLKRIEAMILSMTKEERQNPKLMNPQRRQRIAKGSGNDIAEVNRTIKQFEQMQKMMKQMGGIMKGKKRGFGGLGIPGFGGGMKGGFPNLRF